VITAGKSSPVARRTTALTHAGERNSRSVHLCATLTSTSAPVSPAPASLDRERSIPSNRTKLRDTRERPAKCASNPRPALLSLLILLFAGFVLGGCQQRIHPPANVSDPVRVFVVDYGRHASLALPKEEENGLVEWSWGDWNWFALERTGALEGLQALFASPRSTLSRRQLAPAEDAQELARRLGGEAFAFDVERERARALLRQLEERWNRRRDEAIVHPSGRVFVPEDARYSLTYNSVHELARWLRALGAEVSVSGVTANFELREPRRAAPRMD
jgi:hypothetical protein